MARLSLRLSCLLMSMAFYSCSPGNGSAGQKEAGFNEELIARSLASTQPQNCLFNGEEVIQGEYAYAYLNPTVPPGEECKYELRYCLPDGTLSGSYQYGTCEVGAPGDCLFNGVTVKHGTSVTAYTSSTVAFGKACASVAETRTCAYGVLSGSAPYASCEVNAPRSCLFDGKTIENGDSIVAYESSTSAFGSECKKETRTCNDGTLTGAFQYSSCAVDQAKSCLFDGKTIAHGQSVQAFSQSSVAYGQSCESQTRVCNNGVLSGEASFASCVAGQPASCSFDNKTVAHGESVIAFASSEVPFGSNCASESRTCNNGVLSGTYSQQSCTVQLAQSCTLGGQTIAHGSSIIAYPKSLVPNGSTCISETRVCNNGTLSGSNTSLTCVVDDPIVVAPQSCYLNGQKIASGSSVTVYENSSVAYGQECRSEVRVCESGVLTGSFKNKSCVVEAPKACEFNGQSIAHGASVTAYLTSSVAYGQTCQTEVRQCSNGVLSGTATAQSCVVDPKPADPGEGGGQACLTKNIIWEFPDNCHGNCGKGNGYFKSRYSLDGGQTWIVLQKNKAPQEIEQMWQALIQKKGLNRCGRPNVEYTPSKNKGYVTINILSTLPCDACGYIEIDIEKKTCGGHTKTKTYKKSLQFVCDLRDRLKKQIADQKNILDLITKGKGKK